MDGRSSSLTMHRKPRRQMLSPSFVSWSPLCVVRRHDVRRSPGPLGMRYRPRQSPSLRIGSRSSWEKEGGLAGTLANTGTLSTHNATWQERYPGPATTESLQGCDHIV